MKPKRLNQDHDQLFNARLSLQLNPTHELLKLAKAIPWDQLESTFKPLVFKEP